MIAPRDDHIDIAQLGGQFEFKGVLLQVCQDDHFVNSRGQQLIDSWLNSSDQILKNADVAGR